MCQSPLSHSSEPSSSLIHIIPAASPLSKSSLPAGLYNSSHLNIQSTCTTTTTTITTPAVALSAEENQVFLKSPSFSMKGGATSHTESHWFDKPKKPKENSLITLPSATPTSTE